MRRLPSIQWSDLITYAIEIIDMLMAIHGSSKELRAAGVRGIQDSIQDIKDQIHESEAEEIHYELDHASSQIGRAKITREDVELAHTAMRNARSMMEYRRLEAEQTEID